MSVASEIESRVETLRTLREKKQGQRRAIWHAFEQIGASLSTAYHVAAQQAKKAKDADEESAIWQEMSDACTSALAEMRKFIHESSGVGPKVRSRRTEELGLGRKGMSEQDREGLIPGML